MYNYYSDNKDCSNSGYTSYHSILEHISQEEIFEYVFGIYPEEYTYITSPFRQDSTPGCFFYYDMEDRLRFSDFANHQKIGKIKLSNMDCFDAVQVKYKLRNFYQVMEFIQANILKKRISKPKKVNKKPVRKKQHLDKILINPQEFNISDGEYWSQYEITKDNLKEDKVFRISHYKLMYTGQPATMVELQEICYAYTDFKDQHKKLYMPKRKKNKFITNCTQDDVGGINRLPEKGNQLVISKSYKDYRIIKNQGVNTIWIQNEGMIPDMDIMADLLERFREVIIFFDNDYAGIQAGMKLKEECNKLKISEVRHIHLPFQYEKYGITDPGDLVEKKSISNFRYFLNQNNINIKINK